jgi:hypothetical protein
MYSHANKAGEVGKNSTSRNRLPYCTALKLLRGSIPSGKLLNRHNLPVIDEYRVGRLFAIAANEDFGGSFELTRIAKLRF